jgi:hypothetical protein
MMPKWFTDMSIGTVFAVDDPRYGIDPMIKISDTKYRRIHDKLVKFDATVGNKDLDTDLSTGYWQNGVAVLGWEDPNDYDISRRYYYGT